MVGPDYVRTPAETPAAYRSLDAVPAGWKQATPADQFAPGRWWEVYQDPVLNQLEEQATRANQTIAIAYANFRIAQAQVGQARAGLFPAVNADAGGSRGRNVGNGPTTNAVNATIDASWEVDVWGQVRRAVEASEASAAASAADFAGVQLSIQAQLAQDYFSLRTVDSGQRLLDRTVDAYQRSLDLTQNRYNAGVAARAEVVQAEAQLKSAQAQAIDNRATRAQYEHAIAVLVGRPPQDFVLPVAADVPPPPLIPPGLPSQLLERRPDIAAAERRVAAANAQVGVATAAFYPNINLAAGAGVGGSSFAHLFSLPNTVWSIGASLAQPLFDAGLRKSQLEQTVAAYDATVATYRQTVLTGFQDVEDNLTTLVVLAQEAVIQQQAVAAAQQSVLLTTNQYKAGIVGFIDVVATQTVQFSNERTLVLLEGRQLQASVALVRAPGAAP
jgi:NodT family efflux transporter outer membrane factor (OMF) lipoprotein